MLLLACAVYFVALGNSAIWDANEAFYVETPREMLEGNDFVNPSFNYLPRFNKPVLSYWIVAFLYRLFGVSVGVQRFGIALGALIIIVCAYVLAHRGPRTDDRGSAPVDRSTDDSGTGEADDPASMRSLIALRWWNRESCQNPRPTMTAASMVISRPSPIQRGDRRNPYTLTDSTPRPTRPRTAPCARSAE